MKVTRLGPDFNRFWAAATVSNLGDGIRLSALPLLALTLADDARLIALVSAANLLPWAVLGSVGGALVDRGDRRKLMISGQVFRGLLVFGLALLVAADQATVLAVIVVALGIGSAEVIVDTSSQSAIRQSVIPEALLGRVVATWRMFGMSAGPVGAVLGGVIAEAAGIRWSYLAAAGLGFVAWLMVLWSLRYLDEALAAASPAEDFGS